MYGLRWNSAFTCSDLSIDDATRCQLGLSYWEDSFQKGESKLGKFSSDSLAFRTQYAYNAIERMNHPTCNNGRFLWCYWFLSRATPVSVGNHTICTHSSIGLYNPCFFSSEEMYCPTIVTRDRQYDRIGVHLTFNYDTALYFLLDWNISTFRPILSIWSGSNLIIASPHYADPSWFAFSISAFQRLSVYVKHGESIDFKCIACMTY